jgi:hypothetical protein
VPFVHTEDLLPHLQVARPGAKLQVLVEKPVIGVQNRGVERREQSRLQEVHDVRYRRTESFYVLAVQLKDCANEPFFGIRFQAAREKLSECSLVSFVFIDVRDAQLWLPVKGMCRALEYLLLLGNRAEDDLK